MRDSFGRLITYLRLSVTDRCDLRCRYCMGPHPVFIPKRDVLSLEDLGAIAGAFVDLGVRKIRLTGGEPLVRRGLPTLIAALAVHKAEGRLDEIALSTNGSLLDRHAQALAEAGIARVNVSLDTLDPQVYSRVTGGGGLDRVMGGLMAARQAGMAVKLNCVAAKGLNDGAHVGLVDWAHGNGFDITFIELMPVGDGESRKEFGFLPLESVRAALAARWTLLADDHCSGGPARYLRVAETGRRVGFITAMSAEFCGSCNRVRVDCRGRLHTCLGRSGHHGLKAALDQGPEALRAAILGAITAKPRAHAFQEAASPTPTPGALPERTMNATGG
ncbi:molybdenum cofactor synthesis protein [Rhodospirillum rubrum F11]|uniref:GTP 3',8-cyclase n=1 Tax=Rhodospirillum rubrum (strain ATCC 11170 / ATH 1.1.1 / DSM 467 / LMG 4362 / NCIMB 8255 / S1) TaxID=269796 RepID=Q2RUV6_RHORT|nr:GTP 3',8-cyclase MoaA [Rhodospirillum rubrum]ABC22089.1 Molybdenum cofactor synthesis protein [Rhodospirillum rubrum ATCC 11170]AEO47803.1 molybdenum cofactor synthesis protein [Rhodospirillum rubrum F11]MBK5953679.1 GTP 3',8-cyclase MoaA [Rhodospirillum rubrum]QXG81742.1 GTP 3',8-cyclase MoaA [Rhodospirillum rubrum]HCF16602.1 GTP 3',8-cyclase MoaA [Rhodospirillum rubrum]